ncbi:MAG TPA: C40 family peptidase [Pseudonocardiaceae bacterium]|nr:C40 family peptidase [Pseudonocardiaceae bacterium]
MRRPLVLVAVAATAVVVSFVLVLLVVVAADQDAHAEDGLSGVVCAPAGPPGAVVAGFGGHQLVNATLVVAVGKEMRLPQRAWVVATATAMAESHLQVLANVGVPESLALPHDGVGVDHDSVGLFQQRASWGPVGVRMDPRGAARLFFQRLIAVPGWEDLPLTVAAQRVQASAFPDAYARWEQPANAVLGSVQGIVCGPGVVAGPPGQRVVLPGNPRAEVVVNAALSQVEVPYAWGGGDAHGPTRGISDGGGAADRAGDRNKVGFDCSGLALFAYAQVGVAVPHQTQAIWAAFQPAVTDRAAVAPGDLILLSDTGRASGTHHVAIYLGDGRVVEAPQSGGVVRVTTGIWQSPYWSRQFIGAVRPGVTIARG